jgi:hypothetical protein
MSMGLLVDSGSLPDWHPVVEFRCDKLLMVCCCCCLYRAARVHYHDQQLQACDVARQCCRAAGVSLSRLAMAYRFALWVARHHASHVTFASSSTCPGVTTTLFSSPFAPQVHSNIRDFTAALSDAEAEVQVSFC